jgi:cyclopropane fatty-acyl-phospholipid synthase-like methyltransferase
MMNQNEFLAYEINMGVSLSNSEFMNLANATIEKLKQYPIKTILDFGAGIGAYSLAAINAGYTTYSFEIWDAHKKYMKDNIPNIRLVDEPINTDCLLFIETAEHMTDKEIDDLFGKISPQYILFSSTSEKNPGFDEQWGHINIKTQEEWISVFQQKNYDLLSEIKQPTLWSKIFKKV